MFTVEQSIARIENKITENRRRSSQLRFWGSFLRGVVCPIIYFIGFISLLVGILEATHTMLFPGSHLIYKSWFYLTSEYSTAWESMLIISPPVKFSSTGTILILPIFVWLICWMFWIVGFVELGKRALTQSSDLRRQADADENTLQFQAPTWRQLELLTQVQASNVSGISGNANTINVTNQINNILQRQDENKGWWTKPLGLFLIGLAISIVSKLLE